MKTETNKQLFNKLGISAFYCVDYHDLVELRWVRNPLCTWEEVQEIMEALPYGKNPGGIEVPLFQNFRITPEKELSELRQKYDEKQGKWVDDIVTNRGFMLDGRYEGIAESITGSKPLGQKTSETDEEYSLRMKEHQELKARLEALPLEERETAYEKMQSKVANEFREKNNIFQKIRFMTGNCTFRQEMENADELRKLFKEMKEEVSN